MCATTLKKPAAPFSALVHTFPLGKRLTARAELMLMQSQEDAKAESTKDALIQALEDITKHLEICRDEVKNLATHFSALAAEASESPEGDVETGQAVEVYKPCEISAEVLELLQKMSKLREVQGEMPTGACSRHAGLISQAKTVLQGADSDLLEALKVAALKTLRMLGLPEAASDGAILNALSLYKQVGSGLSGFKTAKCWELCKFMVTLVERHGEAIQNGTSYETRARQVQVYNQNFAGGASSVFLAAGLQLMGDSSREGLDCLANALKERAETLRK